MENQTNEKKGWKILLKVTIGLCIYGGILLALYDTNRDLKEANKKLQEEQGLNSTCSYKRDSLIRENKKLSIYKSLTTAMVHRDEATSMLPYKVGDAVYLKRDSARVMIEDVIIGGAKYEYYVKYRVLHKDNHTEEVKPEMVY